MLNFEATATSKLKLSLSFKLFWYKFQWKHERSLCKSNTKERERERERDEGGRAMLAKEKQTYRYVRWRELGNKCPSLREKEEDITDWLCAM